MPRRKLTRFKAKRPSNNLLEKYSHFYSRAFVYHHPEQVTAVTSEALFGDKRPLIIDLGCGRGEFTVAQAALHPNINYVGIDTHAKSLYVCIKRAAAQQLENVKFLRLDNLNALIRMETSSISEAYLLFPPPVLKEKYLHKDVITNSFISEIQRILQPAGKFHFVTDIKPYFEQKVALINRYNHLTLLGQSQGIEGGLTRFQKLWEGFGELSLRAEFEKGA